MLVAPHDPIPLLNQIAARNGESVTVEFVFQGAGGDLVKTAYVEVGDFAAGRAFLAASATR